MDKPTTDDAVPGDLLTAELPHVLREASVRVVRRGKRPKVRAEGDAPEVEEDEEREIEPEEEVRDDDVEEIEIAISSEAEVERYDWWENKSYIEVLGHGEGEIDLGYARDGLPLFVDHNSRDMVGVVENIRLDADRKLRGTPRFSSSVRGQEIKRDMLDGIRKKISVGYDPGETYDQTERDSKAIRRYRGWKPLEVSSVPIPADYEVGVGRSARAGVRRPELIPVSAAKAKEHNVSQNGTAAAPAASAGVDERHKELSALARQFNLTDKLPEWIESGASVDHARKQVLEHIESRSAEVLKAGGQGGAIDLSARDAQKFSFARAVQQLVGQTGGFEREVSEELYKAMGKSGFERKHPQSILVPTHLLGRLTGVPSKRNMSTGNTAAGSQLVFDEPGGFLEILRNRLMVAQAGAQVLTGLRENVSFVTNPSANTFQWIGETAAPTATFMGTGIKTMSPKNGAALTKFTRQLLAQSAYSIEATVQNDLLKIIALGLDRAAIAAGGGSAPVGILGTTGIGSVTMGANGAAITSIDAWVDLETEVAVDNADLGSLAYMTNARQRGRARKTQTFSGTNGAPIWTGGIDGEVNGYRAYATNQVPNNLTKGSNTGVCHAVIFGNWNDLIIGEWGAVELVVDPYTAKTTIIEVGAHVMSDIMVRYPESFAAIQDALQ